MRRLKADNDEGVAVILREQYLIGRINESVAVLQQLRRPDLSGDDLMNIPVPDPDFVPTQEAIDNASSVLISIQNEINQIPDVLSWIGEQKVFISVTYANAGFPDLDAAYASAMELANSLYDEWTAYQQLRMQQMAIWSAAIAKMEHDLSWQAYVAHNYGTAPGDIPREGKAARPRLLVKGLNDAY